ncbi:zinc finger and BTB domain-containing protein 26-like [Trachinotus anak]|uniref:zinc finger and BTB domain-containing protein 26-like n=1 Tax=Trachinotus anak TaxID=443729 RepID=UPI0039F209EF
MSGSSDTLKFRLPTHGDSILSKMNALREHRRFCDVTLLLGGPRGASVQPLRFHAHRVVLAASSDFLRDQFLLHEGQAELSVGVVSSMEVGKRLLLSCYTGILEVPLGELVSYLTAASALQMSQVVEKCAQAVSKCLSPSLAFLKLERPSEEKEILQPDSGWPGPSSKNQEERDAALPSTSIQEASTEGGGAVVIQSKSSMSQGAKVDNQGLGEVIEERRAVKAKIESCEDAACCFNVLESEEGGGIRAVHTNKPSYQVQHITRALRCKLHPSTAVRDHTSSLTTGSSAQHEEVVDSSRNPDEMFSVAAQQQECGELQDSSIFGLSAPHLSKSHCSGDELIEGPDSILVQRPYLCRRCDRVFQHLESYMGHLKEHRQYLCLVCGKGFSQKTNLSRHIHVHTGVKPFRCPLCHKTFSQKAPLQDHLNLHTGDRPHKCNYCAVHFVHKPGLRRHLKDTHGKSSLQNMLEEAVDSQ